MNKNKKNEWLNCVSICYINYSRKLPKVFIPPTSGIKARLVVYGESGEVFMVPTQQGQRKPKRPTHKDPREGKKKKKKPNKGILLIVLNNGVVRGSHECACGVDM